MQTGDPGHFLDRQPLLGIQLLGRSMMAGDQPPELAIDDQRYTERATHLHILQVLNMDRMHRTQHGEGHVQRFDVRRGRAQPGHRAFGIGNQPLPVDGIQPARVFRNILGRETQAIKSLNPRATTLLYDLAVPVIEKSINHDSVVAGRFEQGIGHHGHGFGRAVRIGQSREESDPARLVPPRRTGRIELLEFEDVVGPVPVTAYAPPRRQIHLSGSPLRRLHT